jgi:hypothetical protein
MEASGSGSGSGGNGGFSRQQLKMRQQRAAEGLRLYQAVHCAREQGVSVMMSSGGIKALAGARENKWWKQVAETAVRELEEAVGMMRDGLPDNARDVSKSARNRRRTERRSAASA